MNWMPKHMATDCDAIIPSRILTRSQSMTSVGSQFSFKISNKLRAQQLASFARTAARTFPIKLKISFLSTVFCVA